MKICIVGAGGVGGYFGARLAAAGSDVVFVARGAHGAAMRANGLTVRSPQGDVRIAAPQVTEDPATIGSCDFVLLCVKLWDTESVAERLRPLLGQDTAVISLQNGVAAEEILARLLGAEHVMGGVSQISVHIAEPGVIQQTGSFARIFFGELDGSASRRQDVLAAACQKAEGMEGGATDEIVPAIWRKFVLLGPMAGICCLYRAAIGAVLADPKGQRQLEALVNEAAAVGRAKGVTLAADVEERALSALAGMPAEMKPSMLIDLEAGRRLELDWLTGAVVRLGRELAVDVPQSTLVYDALKPYALGAVGSAETIKA